VAEQKAKGITTLNIKYDPASHDEYRVVHDVVSIKLSMHYFVETSAY
jgi:hypothetical protein